MIKLFDTIPTEEEIALATGVMRSGTLVMGPHIRSLASQIEGCLGNGGGVVPCASGTDALVMALDELHCAGRGVIVPAMTFSATYEAVLRARAIPVLCDVDDQALTPTITHVRDAFVHAIGNGTSVWAVIIVHLYGWPAYDLQAIVDFCHEQNILLIEDCAQAFGASKGGHMVGTFGDAAAFSFYPTKPLAGIGDGGAAYFSSIRLAKVAAMRRNHGRNEDGYQEFAGYNSRMDEINAAVIRHRLSNYGEAVEKRRELSGRYHQNGLKKMSFERSGRGVPYVYPILVDERTAIQARLAQHGIESRIHYEPAVNDLPYVSERCPNATWASKRVLSLPCHPKLTVEDVDKICDVVRG